MDTANLVFHSTTDGDLSIQDIIHVIKQFLEEEKNASYTLVIGSDSHDKIYEHTGQRTLNLVTAIVMYRHGHGGRYFWMRREVKGIHSLREKIYIETLSSLDFAREFVPKLKQEVDLSSPQYHLEIHVDVGEYGDTREMIKEVVGMVTGMGFVARTKPYSFAASYVADKHT